MPRTTAAANAAAMPASSRRAFLKAGAALGSVAALAIPFLSKAKAGSHPDAELLRLGAHFEREHAVLLDLKAQEAAFEDIFETELERRGLAPTETTMTAFWALRAETGFEEAVARSSKQFDRMDAVTATIRAIQAATLEGLAVKVRAAAYDCHFSLSFHIPPEDMDWQEQCFFGLMREVERMAAEARA